MKDYFKNSKGFYTVVAFISLAVLTIFYLNYVVVVQLTMTSLSVSDNEYKEEIEIVEQDKEELIDKTNKLIKVNIVILGLILINTFIILKKTKPIVKPRIDNGRI